MKNYVWIIEIIDPEDGPEWRPCFIGMFWSRSKARKELATLKRIDGSLPYRIRKYVRA